VFYRENPFSVGLTDQLFQPTSNQVETVEKAFALLKLLLCRVKTVARSYRVSTKNGKTSVEKLHTYKPQPVAVETVDSNETQPYCVCFITHT